ncbi:hypothetical protein BRSU_0226 [Brachyspira suanatina]|uniref:Uncharacterized protein n=1 Tax=Brachyspira suanatina TaxID=381802 RepID=A0A0G4K3K7_9SPIR|nr:hypothetical protein BRSU_0226 [Brachyspira suanatina]
MSNPVLIVKLIKMAVEVLEEYLLGKDGNK